MAKSTDTPNTPTGGPTFGSAAEYDAYLRSRGIQGGAAGINQGNPGVYAGGTFNSIYDAMYPIDPATGTRNSLNPQFANRIPGAPQVLHGATYDPITGVNALNTPQPAPSGPAPSGPSGAGGGGDFTNPDLYGFQNFSPGAQASSGFYNDLAKYERGQAAPTLQRTAIDWSGYGSGQGPAPMGPSGGPPPGYPSMPNNMGMTQERVDRGVSAGRNATVSYPENTVTTPVAGYGPEGPSPGGGGGTGNPYNPPGWTPGPGGPPLLTGPQPVPWNSGGMTAPELAARKGLYDYVSSGAGKPPGG
jgi:hypothetical protein